MIIEFTQGQKTHISKRSVKIGLSNREQGIYLLLLQGKTYPNIAEECCISEKTVKFHVGNILKKTKIGKRYQLYTTLNLVWPEYEMVS